MITSLLNELTSSPALCLSLSFVLAHSLLLLSLSHIFMLESHIFDCNFDSFLSLFSPSAVIRFKLYSLTYSMLSVWSQLFQSCACMQIVGCAVVYLHGNLVVVPCLISCLSITNHGFSQQQFYNKNHNHQIQK